MSILNDTSDGNARVLKSICKFLINEPKITRKELEAIFIQGSSERSMGNTPLVSDALNKWTELGLFQDDKLFDFTDEVYAKFEKINLKKLVELLGLLYLKKENNPLDKFWFQQSDIERDTFADFTRGATWLLLQNGNFYPSWSQNVDTLRSRQLKEKLHVTIKNDYQYTPSQAYMSLLGFIEPGFDNKYTFIIDPSRAIEEELDAIFHDEEDLDSDIFMED